MRKICCKRCHNFPIYQYNCIIILKLLLSSRCTNSFYVVHQTEAEVKIVNSSVSVVGANNPTHDDLIPDEGEL